MKRYLLVALSVLLGSSLTWSFCSSPNNVCNKWSSRVGSSFKDGFKSACEKFTVCYTCGLVLGGSNSMGKEMCDVKLYSDLAKYCTCTNKVAMGWRGVCLEDARTYYNMARNEGDQYHKDENEQRQNMIWCPPFYQNCLS